MITCGCCHGKHASVEAVRMCHDTRRCLWQVPAAPGFMVDFYNRVISMDEAVTENEDFAAQQAGEIWAENAWLRHAENQGAYEPEPMYPF